jgi:uncharacterized membrane protein YhaH (DUF805 family)
MNDGLFDWSQLFLSSSGRLGRGPFLIAMTVVILALLLFENAVPPLLRELLAILFCPLLVFSSACVLSKRLHDRGRSGWWAALILLAFSVNWPQPHGFWSLFVLVILWAVVELGLMPGEQGANRFGPNPSKTPAIAV